MQNDVAATIQCSNQACKATNNDTDKYCQQCGMPLTKRYLWAVGAGTTLKVGDMVQSRYLLIGDRIFLDTLPINPPETRSSDISYDIKPYLRLVPYRLHIPQVYAQIPAKESELNKILLLEDAAIYGVGEIAGQLMPQLSTVWKDATSLRQLHWLWQIAGLWQPLCAEGVASSLLDEELVRVEASIIRLLQLNLDFAGMPPTLAQLGELWHQRIAQAKPAISEYLERLCYGLMMGDISHPDDLVISLEEALADCGKSLSYNLTTSTLTDKGPTRQRNEDACFPPSGTTTTVEKSPPIASTLTIVCDGIGGHEGGNVASNLAIEAISEQVKQLILAEPEKRENPLISALEQATHVANDRICDRNDSEDRTGRQRMGTTLVMALAHQQQMYLTHVGDSRAYLITRTGCHQITLDDDVAAREVRLGYSFYSTAILAPSSGSLIQALGMSLALHPTVNRFILDEDCVFLLCSDGLSDYDRVEQHWDTEILPMLEGKTQVANVTARLVEIANTYNGHDNVTVGVIHYKGNFSEPLSPLRSSLALFDPNPPEEVIAEAPLPIPEPIIESPATIPIQVTTTKNSAPKSIIAGLILLLGLGGVAYLFIGPFQNLWKPKVNSTVTTIEPVFSPEINLKSVFQIKQPVGVTVSQIERLSLRQKPETDSKAVVGIFAGNIVQVARVTTLDQQKWLLLKVCARQTPGQDLSGWIPETEIVAAVEKAPANTCFSSNTPQSPANTPGVELPK